MKTVNIRTYNRLKRDYDLLRGRYQESLARNRELLRLVKIKFGKAQSNSAKRVATKATTFPWEGA